MKRAAGYGVMVPERPGCVISGERLGKLVLDAVRDDLPRFGDSSDMWIDDPERAARCWAGAEDGCDGSTHAEVIQDQRDGVDGVLRRGLVLDCIHLYLDSVERWHRSNGSLYEQVG